MTRRRLFILGFAMGALCIGGTTYLALAPRVGVTEGNFERISKGMSITEVRRLLGESEGFVYRTGWLISPNPITWKFWCGPTGMIYICFDEEMKVVTKDWQPGMHGEQEGLFDRVRRYLGL